MYIFYSLQWVFVFYFYMLPISPISFHSSYESDFDQWNACGEHHMDCSRYVSSLIFHWLKFWSLGSWQHWTSRWFIWSHHLRPKVIHHYSQCRLHIFIFLLLATVKSSCGLTLVMVMMTLFNGLSLISVSTATSLLFCALTLYSTTRSFSGCSPSVISSPICWHYLHCWGWGRYLNHSTLHRIHL